MKIFIFVRLMTCMVTSERRFRFLLRGLKFVNIHYREIHRENDNGNEINFHGLHLRLHTILLP